MYETITIIPESIFIKFNVLLLELQLIVDFFLIYLVRGINENKIQKKALKINPKIKRKVSIEPYRGCCNSIY